MNSVDALLFAIFLICGVRGFVRGLFREVMGLAGFVLGTIAAMTYGQPAAELLRGYVELGHATSQIGASILVFTVVNILVHLIAVGFDRLAKAMFLSGVTRVAGAAVGIGKSVVLVALVLFVLRTFVPLPKVVDAIDGSVLAAPLAEAAGSALRAGAGVEPAGPNEA